MKRGLKALKSVISAALAGTMLLCILPTVAAANGVGEHLLGDVNLSGNVDITDVTAIQKDLVGLVELSKQSRELADVNADGEINITDATYIQKYCAGSITTFPGSEIEGIELIEGLNDITVKIEGEIPQGARLALSPVEKSSVDKLIEKMGADRAVFACDIKIYDKENAEWQPSEPVKITISGVTDIGEYAQAGVYHVSGDFEQAVENADEAVQSIEDVTMNAEQGEAVFETGGFSTFVGYTVDFHFENKTYSIPGESNVLLSKIFSELGAKNYDATKVTKLTFSTPDYIKIEKQENGDWLLTSLAPFQTDEKLTMTFENGEVFELKVTDYTLPAAYNGTVITRGTHQFQTYYGSEVSYINSKAESVTGKVLDGSDTVAYAFKDIKFRDEVSYAPGFTIGMSPSDENIDNPYYGVSNGAKAGKTLILQIPKNTTAIHLAGPITIKTGCKLKIDFSLCDNDVTIYRAKHVNGEGDWKEYYYKNSMFVVEPGASLEINNSYYEKDEVTGKVVTKTKSTKLTISGKNGETETIHKSEVPLIDIQDGKKEATDDSNTEQIYRTKIYPYGFVGIYNTNFEYLNFTRSSGAEQSQGGAIRFGNTRLTQVNIEKCKFSYFKNSTQKEGIKNVFGTGIYVMPGFEATKANSYVSENENDGKFSQTRGQFRVMSCTFKDMEGTQGAGIWFKGKADRGFIVSKCTFDNCNATGFVYYKAKDQKVDHIKASGGAIYIDGTIFGDNDNKDDTAFDKNNKPQQGCRFIGNTFSNCTAENGSALYFSSSAVVQHCILDTCTVYGCETWLKDYKFNDGTHQDDPKHDIKDESVGGTIKTVGPSTVKLTVKGGDYYNNITHLQGGAFYFNAAGSYKEGDKESDLKIKSSFTITNATDENGNKIYCEIHGNKALIKGGGIYTEATSEIKSGKIYENVTGYLSTDKNTDKKREAIVSDYETNNYGGGILQHVYNNDNVIVDAKDTTLTLGKDVEIYKNNAFYGGGVGVVLNASANVYRDANLTSPNKYTEYNVNFKLNGAQVYENTATHGGGIAYLPLVYGENSTINYYPLNADGAVDKSKGRNQTLKSDTLNAMVNGYSKSINIGDPKNLATIRDNTAKGNGGGIYMRGENSLVNVTNAEIYGNQSKNGGAVYITGNGAKVNVTNGKIGDIDAVGTDGKTIFKSNTATIDGGGIYADTDTFVNVSGDNGHINYNHATGNGGGVYADGATVKISKGQINYNVADNGGAVYAINGGKVAMTGGFVRDNRAEYQNGIEPEDDVKTTKIEDIGNLHGVGGGIFVANGKDDKKSEFSITNADATTKSRVEVGIYNNTANFAADDVYSNSFNTQLKIPQFNEMTLDGIKDVEVANWYEDYKDGDSLYDDGLKNGDQGRRYKKIPSSQSNLKAIAPIVEADKDNGNITANDFTNNANAFVCITLGNETKGALTVTKNVEDSFGNIINEKINKDFPNAVFTFTIKNTSGENEQPYKKIPYYVEGADGNTTVHYTDENGTFTLKAGETARFTTIPTGANVVVTETNNEANKIYKNVTDISSTLDGKKLETQLDRSGDNIITTAKTDPVNIEATEKAVVVTSVIRAVKITFKYYDRKLVTGKPADISEDATAYPRYLMGYEIDKLTPKNGSVTSADIISKAKENLTIQNPLDTYHIWTSQEEAQKELAKLSKPALKRTYGTDVEYHTDRYGNVQGENGDKEKWVTVKDANGEATTDVAQIKDITVWVFNQPKTYTVKVYYPNENGNFTGVTPIEYSGIYYNQRLGYNSSVALQNANTNHLNAYGLGGVTLNPASSSIVVGGKALEFKYWAFDSKGKNVASTDKNYNYRVTQDADIYAIYDVSDNKDPGLTLTSLANDYYFDSNGTEKVRLNTVINPFNCTVMQTDDNGKDVEVMVKPQMAGMVYIVMTEKTNLEQVQKAVKDFFDDTTKTGALTTGKNLLNNAMKTAELAEQIKNANAYLYNVATEDSVDATANNTINLTNMNRCNFTLTFTKSAFEKSYGVTAFGVMKYQDKWYVSGNYVTYKGEEITVA